MPKGNVSDEPPGEHKIISHVFNRSGEKFDFQLFGLLVFDFIEVAADAWNVADFTVCILYRPGDLRNVPHHLIKNKAAFQKWSG